MTVFSLQVSNQSSLLWLVIVNRYYIKNLALTYLPIVCYFRKNLHPYLELTGEGENYERAEDPECLDRQNIIWRKVYGG